MKVGIYCRVSTEEQAKEGYSIDAQKQRLTDFVSSQGWEIHDFYIDDGYSAKDLNRPSMKRLKDDVKRRNFDVVLVYKLDRMVRSVTNLHELLELFDKHDVKFKSATEVFDTTSAMGRFFITIVAAMAQWERENLAERVKMGMDTKALKGERNGAVAPYGYDLENGNLIINPMEAEILKRIYSMYVNGHGIKAIVTALNREKVPKRGADWAYGSVYYILTNPVYCGKIRWNYRQAGGELTGKEMLSDGTHPTLITEEEFNMAQEIREGRKKDGKRQTSDFIYSGILKCGRCGTAMIGGARPTKNGRRRFYKCMGRFHKGMCNMPIIGEDSVTKTLLDNLETFDERLLNDIAIPEANNVESEFEDLINQLERELDQLKARKKKWQFAFANGAISLEELKELTAEDSKTETYIKAQLEELPQRKKREPVDVESIINKLRNIKLAWTELDQLTQKQLVRDLFESIVVDADETDFRGGPGSSMPISRFKWKLNDL
ncbi:recombinase family protein [Brevibacillus migulae]|uniref:recombinase family protein n=1 Tax=Brevibacillus migulae TaxID=1644114 RepID=UPI00106E23D3|nr:recombinase family protein [Brevibacillus migulae]